MDGMGTGQRVGDGPARGTAGAAAAAHLAAMGHLGPVQVRVQHPQLEHIWVAAEHSWCHTQGTSGGSQKPLQLAQVWVLLLQEQGWGRGSALAARQEPGPHEILLPSLISARTCPCPGRHRAVILFVFAVVSNVTLTPGCFSRTPLVFPSPCFPGGSSPS